MDRGDPEGERGNDPRIQVDHGDDAGIRGNGLGYFSDGPYRVFRRRVIAGARDSEHGVSDSAFLHDARRDRRHPGRHRPTPSEDRPLHSLGLLRLLVQGRCWRALPGSVETSTGPFIFFQKIDKYYYLYIIWYIKKNKSMIGIFDSGVGGLTVVKEIFKHLPQYQIIYFGDTARLPYGTKGADFVKRYSEKITEWLLNKGAKIIVVACNTSSAWAADSLKKRFKKVPIFEMITPAVKEVRATRVGIIGTPGTIKSRSYEKKLLALNLKVKIFSKSCPLFVPLAEEGWLKEKITEEVIKKYLAPFKKEKLDILILACTHYPLLRNLIQKVIGGSVRIINPAESLAKELKNYLKNNPRIASKIKKGKRHQFFFSDEPYNFEKISRLCFKKKIKAEVKDPF